MPERAQDDMAGLVREDVQSYPRPPAMEPVPHRIIVRHAGVLVADTGAALRVLETHHAPSYYLPRGAVLVELRAVAGGSFCEWKGHARYFDVIVGDVVARRAAWSYDQPTAGFAALAGHIAFYAGRVDEAWVGDTRVMPQPGDFYGGWITPNLVGRIKGAPGTNHW